MSSVAGVLFDSGRKPTCKNQTSKFGRGQRPHFEFWILRRRVSIVAVVASRRIGRRRRIEARGRKPSCKIQNSKFDPTRGWWHYPLSCL